MNSTTLTTGASTPAGALVPAAPAAGAAFARSTASALIG